MQELVPVFSITKAVRLSCLVSNTYRIDPRVTTVLDQVIHEGSEPWSLEILDGYPNNFNHRILRSGKVPRLTSAFLAFGGDLERLDTYVSSLQFLKLDIYSWDALKHRNVQPCLRFSHLTSLSLVLNSFKPLLIYTFPALKHFTFDLEAELEASDLITALKVMGGNLVMLLDYCELSEDTLPHEIWSLCPKLQSFGTSLRWPVDPYLPPSLCEFHLPLGIDSSQPRYLPIDVIPIDSLRKAGIKVVCFAWTWLYILEEPFHTWSWTTLFIFWTTTYHLTIRRASNFKTSSCACCKPGKKISPRTRFLESFGFDI
jgi:hypothetical protein